ncbi:sensor histidine kinase NtrY-like [Roseitranquillus sediminis]|uniref:sensor histidine kinase NtrY-like n=1 Tax=Roseitranquillus sediminis TaxID=2809051 RepID=UPI001D0BF717|nr:PAS domain-containing sensor histidine kinase [Roseitranquillus sediminis]MBM9595556.1 PAS domain-containing sensor histidine kinase [Roseitranquillus sediminis]
MRLRSVSLQRLSAAAQDRNVRSTATLGLVLLGPILVFATFVVLGPLDHVNSQLTLRLILLADLVYVLVVAALVMRRIAGMIAARRAKSAGSRLHLRLTGVFALVALAPTVSVAVFAGLTINVGLEGWFSDRVRSAVAASLAAAEAYEEDERRDLRQDATVLAEYLEANRRAAGFLFDGDIRRLLTQGQNQIQRGLREAYVIDGSGEIRARGERSYLFDFERPAPEQIEAARDEGLVVIEDWDTNEFRALVSMPSFNDRFLYVSREVDGQLLALLDDTQQTVRLYNQLESERGRILFEFGLLYLGFAVILILAAIWLGLWFAERLSRPVGQLAGAAQRVGAGDLDVHVREVRGDDEIAMLGRLFNQMTRQLKAQRETLLATNRQIERRRRLFDSVLASVTAGVVGLDSGGRVTFVNRSAERLLRMEEADGHAVALAEAVPEFAALFDRLQVGGAELAQEEIPISREGAVENLLVRMSTRRSENGNLEGYVVAFDDVTDLVTAQRMAAWGDVARRIAHEIKNPLTPIQLSAERIKRKFRPANEEDAATFDRMTDVIVRQTNDLRRIVDEFSRFARMPQPERTRNDLRDLVRDAVTLQDAAQEAVQFTLELPDHPVRMDLDSTLVGQALTNLIKNAGEALEARRDRGDGFAPRIEVRLALEERQARLTIADNGIGLPADRARLFEPYVTTREKGTGLGLPIVRKIVEEHGGTMRLGDAPAWDESGHVGACVEILLPTTDAAPEAKTRSMAVGGA